MRRGPIVLCCVVALLLAGPVGTGSGVLALPLSLQIDVETTWGGLSVAEDTSTRSFTVTCGPPGGDLPLAAHLCQIIQRNRSVMLEEFLIGYTGPDTPARQCSVRLSSYAPFRMRVSSVSVSRIRRNGPPNLLLRGAPTGRCSGDTHNARNDVLAVYAAAASGNDAYLTAIARGLRCLDDLAAPCIPELVESGTRGSIEAARRAEALRPFAPLFAGLDGAEERIHGCQIRAGGGVTAEPLAGFCAIDTQRVELPSSRPMVVFFELWKRYGENATHSWRVRLDGFGRGARVVSVTQSGPPPPQFRR